jgi:hypothetical protein
MDYHELDPSFEDRKEPTPKAEPVLPWESTDPQEMVKWLKPPVQKSTIEQSVIGHDLLHDLPMIRKALQQVSEPEPVFTLPQTGKALAKFVDRLGKTWDSKKHRAAISTMLSGLKSSLKFKSSPETDAAWERLCSHATDYVCAAIHAEAGEDAI